MKARDIMTHTVIRCTTTDTLERAAQHMWENDCGCLPVLDDDLALAGMITDRDICMAAYTRGIRLGEAPVASAMSKPVWCCKPDDDLTDIEELMSDKQIRRVPVLDIGELVGIVTLGDIARAAQAHPVRGVLASPTITKTLAGISSPRVPATAAE
jgi:CBS domain-containing protein